GPEGLAQRPGRGGARLVACARAVEGELMKRGLPVPGRGGWDRIEPAPFASTPARRAAGRAFRRRLGLGPQDFVLLALANPRPQKRLDRLPQVLAATRAELARRGLHRQARLIIAGEASPSSPAAIRVVEEVRARVDQLELAE